VLLWRVQLINLKKDYYRIKVDSGMLLKVLMVSCMQLQKVLEHF